jgi:hypothetical protein
MENREKQIIVQVTSSEANAAAAVLRGYVAHQRERLGDKADSNPNLRLVEGALRALEARLGEAPADRGQDR